MRWRVASYGAGDEAAGPLADAEAGAGGRGVSRGVAIGDVSNAVGDADAMLNAFRELLALRAYEPEEGEEEETTGPGTAAAGGPNPDENPNGLPGGGDGADAAASALRADALLAEDGYKAETRKRQMRAHEKIITAAKLIGPCVARTPERGYALLAEEMQSAGYASLAHELEMEKALAHLKTRRFTPGAFEEGKRGLRAFEKKDDRLRAKAATNLAFLYYQEGDVENAATYADLSVRANKYDARALVNRGVVSWRRGDVGRDQRAWTPEEDALLARLRERGREDEDDPAAASGAALAAASPGEGEASSPVPPEDSAAPLSWEAIAARIGGGRTAKQCRERYDPPWTPAQDAALLALVDRLGASWNRVADRLQPARKCTKRQARARADVLLSARDGKDTARRRLPTTGGEVRANSPDRILPNATVSRADPSSLWEPVNRRRVRGKGWHVDVGPEFAFDGVRTSEGHPCQGAIVLVLLSDCAPGGGGTAFVRGSHAWVAAEIAAAEESSSELADAEASAEAASEASAEASADASGPRGAPRPRAAR